MKKRNLLAILGLILPLVLVLGGCGENDDNNPVSASSNFESPTIVAVDPSHGAAYIPVSTNISVTFSEEMDPPSVLANFECWTDLGPVIGVKSYGDKKVTLDPTDNLYGGKVYYVKVWKGAKDLAGNTMSSDSPDFIFYTGPPTGPEETSPFIESVSPTGSGVATTTTRITVTFTKPMDWDSVSNNFTVSPSISGMTSYNSGNTFYATFASGVLLDNTTYTVTIGAGAKDAYGNPMTYPYSWSFSAETWHTGTVDFYAYDDTNPTVYARARVVDEDLTAGSITVTVSIRAAATDTVNFQEKITLTRVSAGVYEGMTVELQNQTVATGDTVVVTYIDEHNADGNVVSVEDTFDVV